MIPPPHSFRSPISVKAIILGRMFCFSPFLSVCGQSLVNVSAPSSIELSRNKARRHCVPLACLAYSSFSSMIVQSAKIFFHHFSAMGFRRAGPLWFATVYIGSRRKCSQCFSARFCKAKVLYNTAGQHFRNPVDALMRWFRHAGVQKRPAYQRFVAAEG